MVRSGGKDAQRMGAPRHWAPTCRKAMLGNTGPQRRHGTDSLESGAAPGGVLNSLSLCSLNYKMEILIFLSLAVVANTP